jgi:hypothetical protein
MMELTADPGLSILTYSADPGSTSQDGMNLLATWAATLEQEERTHATDKAHRA